MILLPNLSHPLVQHLHEVEGPEGLLFLFSTDDRDFPLEGQPVSPTHLCFTLLVPDFVKVWSPLSGLRCEDCAAELDY